MSDIARLTSTIVERTRQRKIQWEELSGDSYYAELGDLALILNTEGRVRIHGESAMKLWLSLRAPNGKIVDAIYTNEENYEELADLYEMARRQANKVDESISKLETLLRDL